MEDYTDLKKILYLSVRVLSTIVLIVDTVNKQTKITNRTEICEESQLVGGWPAGYLQSVDELNSGPPKTNPSN